MKTIGILGGGNMGTAMAKGMIEKGIFNSSQMTIIEKSEERIQILQKELAGCNIIQDLDTISTIPEVLLLATKPQGVSDVYALLNGKLQSSTLVVSIMAGISLGDMGSNLAPAQIIRVMPNTPSAIGLGMSVFCGLDNVTKENFKITEDILNAIGQSFQVEEERMIDATTAISGSGPAYVFYLAEAMMEGAKKFGFNEEQAHLLAEQTLLGAASLIKATGKNPTQLRKEVTSPGGTTAAAISTFDDQKVQKGLLAGFQAAYDRSLELGKK